MWTVYKYKVGLASSIAMPIDSRILCANIQEGQPTIWVLVDTEVPTKNRRFILIGTGQRVPEGAIYIASVFDTVSQPEYPNGFVWHIFEEEV